MTKKASDRFTAARTAKTAAEYRAAIAGLEADLAALTREHATAEVERDKGILDGGNMVSLRNRIVSVATQISDVQAALSEAGKRQEAAEKREAADEIEALHAKAKASGETLADIFNRYDAALAVFREIHAEADRQKVRLAALNDSLEARSRPDLRVKVSAIREKAHPAPIEMHPGLTRNAQRVDGILRDLGRHPATALRFLPHHRRVGPGVAAAGPTGGIAAQSGRR